MRGKIFTTIITKDAKVSKIIIPNFVLFVSFVVKQILIFAHCYDSLPRIAAAVQPKFFP